MIRIRWSVVGSVLLAGMAWAQSNATDTILAGLRDQPMNPVLLRDMKAAIPNTADAQMRCRLGVLYALGCLASANSPEGLATRAQLEKAFPGNPLLQELADDRISVKCTSCRNGQVVDPCTPCKGSGRCPVCKGTGQQTLAGVGEPRKVKCMYCTDKPGKCKNCLGVGGFPKDCPRCNGTALVVSPEKADILYRRLLRAMAPPPEGKGPVTIVVTAAPPETVAADPGTVKKEWVERSLAAAKAQAENTPLLQNYSITADDIRAARNPALKAAQKEEVMKQLRQKGLAHPSRGHYFFLPFPAGLRYCVADVKRNPYGGYFLKLTSTPPVRNPPAQPLTPREALSETARALCEPLGDFLSDPTLCIPDSDPGAAGLRKGEAIESGAWIIPVQASQWGTLDREGSTCYRSSDELLKQMGFGK